MKWALVALVCVACGDERRERAAPPAAPPQPVEIAAPPPPPPAPAIDAAPPPADASRRSYGLFAVDPEDPNQLTPDEIARLDGLVEGSSEIPACNEVIRQLRRLGGCEKFPSHMRSLLLRSALMFAEDFAREDQKDVAVMCARTVKQFQQTIDLVRC